jgi:hypothetical protein
MTLFYECDGIKIKGSSKKNTDKNELNIFSSVSD